MEIVYHVNMTTAGKGDSGTDYRVHFTLHGLNAKGEMISSSSFEILSCTGLEKNNGNAFPESRGQWSKEIPVIVKDLVSPTSITISCLHSDAYRPCVVVLRSGKESWVFPNYSNAATEKEHGVNKPITIPVLDFQQQDWDESHLICPTPTSINYNPVKSQPVLVCHKRLPDLNNSKYRTLKVSAFYHPIYFGTAIKGGPIDGLIEISAGVENEISVTEQVSASLGVEANFLSISAEISKETNHTQRISSNKTVPQKLTGSTDSSPSRIVWWQKVYIYEVQGINQNWGSSAIFDDPQDSNIIKTWYQEPIE